MRRGARQLAWTPASAAHVRPSARGSGLAPAPEESVTAAAAPPGTWDISPRSAWKGVDWSLSYIALLVYLFVIVSYRLNIGDVAMAIALAGLIFEGRGIRFPTPLALLTAMLAWAFAGSFVSPWPGVVYDKIDVLWKLCLIALVAFSVLNDRKRLRLFMLAFALFYAAFPARGTLFNYFLGGYSLRGRALWNFIYANPNDLAALTLLQLSMAAGLVFTEPKGWYRRGAVAAVVVLPIIILLTQSRAGFLGLGAFGLFALWGHRKKGRAVGIIAFVVGCAVMFVPSKAWQRFGMISTIGAEGTQGLTELDDLGSAEQRWQIWQTSFRIIADNPVNGVGLGAYPDANASYSPRLGRRDTHSTYLNVTAETGIPGLLLFLAVVGTTLAYADRIRRRLRRKQPRRSQQIYMMELGLIAYLVAGIFGSYARLTFLYIHIVLLWTLAEVYRRDLAALLPSRARVRGG